MFPANGRQFDEVYRVRARFKMSFAVVICVSSLNWFYVLWQTICALIHFIHLVGNNCRNWSTSSMVPVFVRAQLSNQSIRQSINQSINHQSSKQAMFKPYVLKIRLFISEDNYKKLCTRVHPPSPSDCSSEGLVSFKRLNCSKKEM